MILVNKKDRRHDGWYYPNLAIRAAKQFIINNCLEPIRQWDDWMEWRDGSRQLSGYDKTKMKNKKNRKLLLRRKARKRMKSLTGK